MPVRKPFRVSVVVTCYNLETHIREGVESVLSQTVGDRISEIIVVDDGSNDRSRAIIADLASRHPLVKPLFQENGGASSARNTGIAAATQSYIAFLDGDDVWKQEKLARQLAYAEKFPQAGMLFCDFEHVRTNPERKEVVWVRDYRIDDPDPLKEHFLYGGPILPSASLIRRDVFDVAGLFDTSQKYCNDDEMWMRMAHHFPIMRTPGVWVIKRDIEGGISSHIEERLRAMHEISQKVYAMRPDLERFRHRREARLDVQAGLGCLARGKEREARKYFAHAVSLYPWSGRFWSYLILSFLPGKPKRWLDGAKSVLRVLRCLVGGRSPRWRVTKAE